MRQEIATYLSSFKNQLYELTKYLYENPEESFKEFKSSQYLTELLQNNGFSIRNNFLDMNTAFYSLYGEGHPKICFICEYDSDPVKGQIYGNNLSSAISIGAALALTKAINKIGGSVAVIGVPGEIKGGSKLVMFKQGGFDDIDTVLQVKPHIQNMYNDCCPSILPLKAAFYEDDEIDKEICLGIYSPLSTCLLFVNYITLLLKDTQNGFIINKLSFNNNMCSFNIVSQTIKQAEHIRNQFELLASTLGTITGLKHELVLHGIPLHETICSKTLKRLVAHNLKECGVIDIENGKCNPEGLSLGCISHSIPTICPYISIVKNTAIDYPSTEFAEETLSSFAQDRALRAAQAMAFTALDFIEKQNLLSEAKLELT